MFDETNDPSQFLLPVEDVRPGDQIEVNGRTMEVVDSRPAWPNTDHQWTITVVLDDMSWNWGKYDVYGQQVDLDGNRYWPEDCLLVQHFQLPDQLMVWCQTGRYAASSTLVLHPETLRPLRWWAVVYEVDRGYGGPEEGGWWYDCGELVVSVPCRSSEEAETVADQLRDRYPRSGLSGSVTY